MVSTLSRPRTPAPAPWSQVFAQPAPEFAPTALPVVSGALPPELQGSLYRNGPARLERGGQAMGHWFDGDGAILGIQFTPTGATGVYRYVQTAGYAAEAEADALLYGNYGTTPPGPLWRRWQRGFKNVANTSVLALPDQLLALWEGGQPHGLDLETLATHGPSDLGALAAAQPYSAHPKVDPKTGEIYNFGVSVGKQGQLHLYRSDASGQIQQQNTIALAGIPMIHDFVMAGGYLVFCITPVRLNPWPLLLRWSNYSDCLRWQPEQGTQILVVDRQTLTVVSRGETDPWYLWHYGNGAVNDRGHIEIDLIRYADFNQTNQFLKEVPTGRPQTRSHGSLWRLQIHPQSGQVQRAEEVMDRTCEFPVVNPRQVGQAWRYTYCAIRSDQDAPTDLFGAIARFDHHRGDLMVSNLGSHRYPTEPIFAPHPTQADQGWILTVVFDGDRSCSEVWIFDSQHVDEEPLCRLGLPSVVPMGFHGTWKPA